MPAKHANKTTFGIIGYGRFGKLWARALSRRGRVLVFDKKSMRARTNKKVKLVNLKEAVNVDILFLAVPISELENCCRRIAPLLKPDTLVLDTCSVKIDPVRVMKKNLPKNQPILATHPLFGPDSARVNKGIRGLKIVVCRVQNSRRLERKILQTLRSLGLRIIFSTPAKHDGQMARSQALVHIIGRGLGKLNLRHQEISTPDYENLLRMHEMVANDTRQLFFDMIEKNPFAKNVGKRLINNLEKLDMKISLRNGSLENLRRQINNTDENIIKLLSLRAMIAEKIGDIKKRRDLPVYDESREHELDIMHRKLAKRLKVDPKSVAKIFSLVMKNSRNLQT